MSEFPLPKIKSARQKLKSLFEQGLGAGEAEIGVHIRQRSRDNELQSARSPSEDDIRDSKKYLPYIAKTKRTLLAASFRIQDESTQSQPRLGYNRSRDLLIYDNLSRDISHIRDKKERASSQLRYNQKELREIVGVKKPQVQKDFPLPIDLKEIEAILMKDDIIGSKSDEEFLDESPTHDPQEESNFTFDDKMHENFVTDLTNAKKAFNEYRNNKRAEALKGSDLSKSPNSNLSLSVAKLYGLNSSEMHQFHKRTKSSKTFDRKTMDQTLNQLEEKILEMANIPSDDARGNPARGPPSGRREVELLETWLSYMLDIYVETADNFTSEQKERAAQLIYALCFKEVIRQVSVHCVERGRLLDRIWKASVSLFTKYENSFIRQIEEIKTKFKEIVSKTRKDYERNLDVAVKNYSDINAELRRSNRTNEDLSKQLRTLNSELEETKVRNKQLREAVDVFIKSSKEKSLLKSPGQFEDLDLKVCYIQRFENKLMRSSSPHTRSITTSTSEDFDQIVSAALYSSKMQANPCSVNNPVLIQGFFDETKTFHRIRQFHKDSNGLIVGADYDGDILSIVENKNKATNTSTDGHLKVIFLTEEECRYMWDRIVLLDDIDNCSLMYKKEDEILQHSSEKWKRNLMLEFDKIVGNRVHTWKMRNRNARIQVPDTNNTQIHSSESSYVKSDSDDEIKIVSYKDSHRLQSQHSEPALDLNCLPLDIESLAAHLDQLKNLSDSILQKAGDLHTRNILLNDPVLSSLHADLLSAWSVINQDIQIIQNLKEMLQRGDYQHSSQESSDLSDSASDYSEVDQDLLIDIAMRMGPIKKRRSSFNKEEQVKIHNSEILQRIVKLSCRYDRETHTYGKHSAKSRKLLQMIIKNIKRARYSKVVDTATQSDLTWEMVHARNFLVAKSNLVKKLSSEIARKIRSFEKKDEAKEDRKKVESLMKASETLRPTKLKKEWSKEEELTSIDSTPNSVQTFRFARSRDPPASFNMFSVLNAASAKKPHPASQLVAKILSSNKNKNKASTMCTLSIKRLSKIVTSTYVSRIVAIRENPILKRVPLHEMLYDDLNKKYGLKNMTDKKMKEIIYSGIACVDKSLKIHNFMKFVGLFEDYTVADLNIYISAFEFLAINTSGQLEIDEHGLENQVHISKAQMCGKEFFEEKLHKDAWEIMKQEIEAIKEPDLDLVQKSASKLKLPSEKVNIDRLLMLFISYYQRMKRQVHLKICRALDDEVPSECGFSEEEFINLVLKLNSTRVTREELASLFGIFGDFIIGEESGKPSREKMILLEHVLSICVDLGLVSYDSNEFVRDSLAEVE